MCHLPAETEPDAGGKEPGMAAPLRRAWRAATRGCSAKPPSWSASFCWTSSPRSSTAVASSFQLPN